MVPTVKKAQIPKSLFSSMNKNIDREPTNLADYDKDGLEIFFEKIGEKPFRAQQIIQWIHKHGVIDISKMTTLSINLRKILTSNCIIKMPKIKNIEKSNDGTIKLIIELLDKNLIETIFIPDGQRGTLCISSQAGCQLNCSFCATAQSGFNKNLDTSEIIGQVWLAAEFLNQFESKDKFITNIVFMGMGEPLLNLVNVLPAIKILLDSNAYNISHNKITVSTAGVVPGIKKLNENTNVSLAVSLHAPTDTLRDKLVPLNKRYPLKILIAACKEYVGQDRNKTITFEYTLIKNINDSVEQAKILVKLVRPIKAKINLIPYNNVVGLSFESSTETNIKNFWKTLNDGGIITTIRKNRGNDISAACGQLSGIIKKRSNITSQNV